MGMMASQIASLAIVYSTVYSGADKKNPSKLRGNGLCTGNSPGTTEFPTQMASNVEYVPIWWHHLACIKFEFIPISCSYYYMLSKVVWPDIDIEDNRVQYEVVNSFSSEICHLGNNI